MRPASVLCASGMGGTWRSESLAKGKSVDHEVESEKEVSGKVPAR
jgi:hypothetical protein